MPTARPALRRGVPVAALLLMLPFVAGPSLRAAETMGVEELAIRGLVKGFAAQWKEQKPKATLQLLAEDAVLIPPGGHPPVQGLDPVRDYWWPPHAPELEVSRYDIEIQEVYIELDLAYVRARYRLDYRLVENDEAGSRISSEGNWLAIIKRGRNTIWRITHIMWDEGPPAPSASE